MHYHKRRAAEHAHTNTCRNDVNCPCWSVCVCEWCGGFTWKAAVSGMRTNPTAACTYMHYLLCLNIAALHVRCITSPTQCFPHGVLLTRHWLFRMCRARCKSMSAMFLLCCDGACAPHAHATVCYKRTHTHTRHVPYSIITAITVQNHRLYMRKRDYRLR